VVYQRGMALKSVDPKAMRVEMVAHDVPAKERLEYLDGIVASSICGLDASPDVLRLLESVMAEEEGLVRTEEERRKFLGNVERAIKDERFRLKATQRRAP
jgi:hypothetical protein